MKHQWQKQEARLHREGARRVAGSGGGYIKGDNKGVNFLVQAKATEKERFVLTFRDVMKTISDAVGEDRIPVMQLEIGEESHLYAVLREQDWGGIEEDACTGYTASCTHDFGAMSAVLHQSHLVSDCSPLLIIAFGPARVVVLPWAAFLETLEEAELPL